MKLMDDGRLVESLKWVVFLVLTQYKYINITKITKILNYNVCFLRSQIVIRLVNKVEKRWILI